MNMLVQKQKIKFDEQNRQGKWSVQEGAFAGVDVVGIGFEE